MEYLEERYPEPALLAGRPRGAGARRASGCSASTTGSATPTTRRGAATGARELDARLAELDRALEAQPYLSGREYGLADIGYVPWILRALERFERRARARARASWLERVSRDPPSRPSARSSRRCDAAAARRRRLGAGAPGRGRTSCSATCAARTRTSAATCRLDPARARLAAAAGRPRDRAGVRGRGAAAPRPPRRHRRGAARALRPRRLRRRRRPRPQAALLAGHPQVSVLARRRRRAGRASSSTGAVELAEDEDRASSRGSRRCRPGRSCASGSTIPR